MMIRRTFVIALLILAGSALALAQEDNTNSVSTRTRTVAPKPSPTPKSATESSATQNKMQRPKSNSTTAASPSAAIRAAFDKIIEGIRRANVDMYMTGYWNSRDLILFNYNGTVTKGWEQLRKNRESSFPQMKDVKLDIRDYHVQMLGRDGAVVSCLWTQTQTFNGAPDNASGRMTLVFKRVGTEWRAVHLHTSPDKPEPARVPASEQTPPE